MRQLLFVAALVLSVSACGDSTSSPVTVMPAAPAESSGSSNAGTASPPASPVAGTAAVLACPDVPPAGPVKGGLPKLEMACLGDGPAVDLAALRGVPTVVNVWAAWCVNCSREMPLFNEAAAKAGERVRFLGLHAFAEADEGRDAATRFPVRFPSLQDPGPERIRAELGVVGPPYTFFVRPDGTVAYTKVGEIRSAAELSGLLAEHLAVQV